MIGILGGMGPESTVDTYRKMIIYCQKEYGAQLDRDFPPILIYSMPVPDVVENQDNDPEVLEALKSGIKKLDDAGADFSIIPCNSMQGFVPELRKDFTVLSIVEETLLEAKKTNIQNWGILATEVTIQKGYFQKAFAESGLSIIEPDPNDQILLTRAIRQILSGEKEKPKKLLEDVAYSLKEKSAEAILLACTDLPLVISDEISGLQTIDTTDVIAKAAIDYFKSTIYQRGNI
ncbi:amino acid racemase [Candidatus Micrarchaeota archaeon]|nr:amino acid racemase [Candidatus Micrarchaeota archaeon]MBU1681415.1 amino acid racemase [Candidatus Micrarchaeota archaeon]